VIGGGGVSARRVKQSQQLSSSLVDLGLFHEEDFGAVEVGDYDPPHGQVMCDLDDLLRITREKWQKPKLADRGIQVTVRRLLKFIPPVWKPIKVKDMERKMMVDQIRANQDLRQQHVPDDPWDRGESQRRISQSSKMDTRKVHRGDTARAVRGPGVEIEGAFGNFYEQLCNCPTGKEGDPPSGSGRAFVWIRRDLFDERKFGESNCYPVTLSDRVDRVASVCRRRRGIMEGSHLSNAWRGGVAWWIRVVVVAVVVGGEGAAGGRLVSSPTIGCLSIRSSSWAMALIHTHSMEGSLGCREVHPRGLLGHGVLVKARTSNGSARDNLNSSSRRRIKVSKVLQKQKTWPRVMVVKGAAGGSDW
jgi:hypothetical protein